VKKKSSPRRDLFPQEYIVDFNATKAAIRCGYSKKTARSQGSELLTKPDIQKAIAAAIGRRSKRTEITADRVLQELAIIAFSDIQNYIEINDDTGAIRAKGFNEKSMPEGASRALESITENRTIREDAKGEDSIINEKISFKLWSKTDALKLAMQHLGMLPNKVEAPDLEDALNRNSMTIEGLRKSLAGYKKAKA
jgi:phage terminase small subunit